MKNSIKFIDLFAGIGGFHQALSDIGAECIFASEINKDCRKIYELNFPKTKICGDINKNVENIPSFDFLCAGFPCQPFSKAGKQKGFKDETRGTLFYTITGILKKHSECKYILLENVKNLADNKKNWEKIQLELSKLNYFVNKEPIILSPHEFGIPQIRERLFIVGIKKECANEKIRKQKNIKEIDLNLNKKNNYIFNSDNINKMLDKKIQPKYFLDKKRVNALSMWYEFKKITNFDIVGAPTWVEYFGYKLDNDKFYKKHDHNDKKYSELPEWKKVFVKKNRDFYLKHKKEIDIWIKKHDVLNLPLIYQKFEWNCGNVKDIKDTIIQFRQSGIRVKRRNYFPALVAINNTPIIYDYAYNKYRYLTPRETSKLQSFRTSYKIINDALFYKQIGNAVNVEIIKQIANGILKLAKQR